MPSMLTFWPARPPPEKWPVKYSTWRLVEESRSTRPSSCFKILLRTTAPPSMQPSAAATSSTPSPISPRPNSASAINRQWISKRDCGEPSTGIGARPKLPAHSLDLGLNSHQHYVGDLHPDYRCG